MQIYQFAFWTSTSSKWPITLFSKNRRDLPRNEVEYSQQLGDITNAVLKRGNYRVDVSTVLPTRCVARLRKKKNFQD